MAENWFEVDREGLAKLLERRGKSFAVLELLSNAWDTDARNVVVTLEAVPGRPLARLKVVDDDPEGFRDLSHAFTLFAESEKKAKAETRGRFNLGEKLVLALCEEATITTTKGTVTFNKSGRRRSAVRTAAGSEVSLLLRLTREELEEASHAVRTLIPPLGVATTFNGAPLVQPELLQVVKAALPTEAADADGNLRRTRRMTTVCVYAPRPGETATLYELGVPVVATGDRWHVDIDQKVPLNMDRDNVPPAFLREVRVLVVNAMRERLTAEDAQTPWVREATDDARCSDDATAKVLDLRFGPKRVAFDPSDPEANALAVTQGYTVVHGGMLSSTEWGNAKAAGLIQPAGKVTPSPKPFSPDGSPLKLLLSSEYTYDVRRVVDYAGRVGRQLLGCGIEVHVTPDLTWPFAAAYGKGRLVLNLGRLGHAWFSGPWARIDALLIHEFAHHYESNHLSEAYHEALCDLGARLCALALTHPEQFPQDRRAGVP